MPYLTFWTAPSALWDCAERWIQALEVVNFTTGVTQEELSRLVTHPTEVIMDILKNKASIVNVSFCSHINLGYFSESVQVILYSTFFEINSSRN